MSTRNAGNTTPRRNRTKQKLQKNVCCKCQELDKQGYSEPCLASWEFLLTKTSTAERSTTGFKQFKHMQANKSWEVLQIENTFFLRFLLFWFKLVQPLNCQNWSEYPFHRDSLHYIEKIYIINGRFPAPK